MTIRLRTLNTTLTAVLLLMSALLAGCTTSPQRDASQDPQAIMQEARKAYTDKDYEKVFQLVLPLAAAGNADAQYTLGYLYYHGLGVQKSETQAMNWIQRSAAQGNKKALSALK